MVKSMADSCPYLHSFYHESGGYVPFCEGWTLGWVSCGEIIVNAFHLLPLLQLITFKQSI